MVDLVITLHEYRDLSVAARWQQIDDLLNDGTNLNGFQFKRCRTGPGEHVESQIVDSIKISSQYRPRLRGQIQIPPGDGQLHCALTATEALHDVLDSMGDRGDGFTHADQSSLSDLIHGNIRVDDGQ